MEIVQQLSQVQLLNQFWLLMAFVIPMVILSRMVVAGSRFSPILVIVIFGLGLGFAMVEMGIATPGLPEFPLVDFMSRTTIIALVVSFFVGGQELRKILSKQELDMKDIVVPSKEEMFLGTGRTQFIFILRSFFLLVGLEGFFRMMIQPGAAEGIMLYYPILALIGLAASFLLIDHKAQIDDKKVYMRKGVIETVLMLVILFVSYGIAMA
ncbi:MAG: hypothetical protein F9K39_08960, partial [Exiguobacterium chiriqhucha]